MVGLTSVCDVTLDGPWTSTRAQIGWFANKHTADECQWCSYPLPRPWLPSPLPSGKNPAGGQIRVSTNGAGFKSSEAGR